MTQQRLKLRKILSKAEIVDSVAKKLDCSRTESSKLLNIILAFIRKKLQKGHRVQLSPFGIFTIKKQHLKIQPESSGKKKQKNNKQKKIVVFRPGKAMERRKKA